MPEQTQPLVSASLSDRFEVFQMLCQAEAPVVVDGSPRSALVVADHTVPGSQQRRHRREVVRHSGAAVKDDYKIVSCSARHEDRQPGASTKWIFSPSSTLLMLPFRDAHCTSMVA